jgi:arsenical pump membrane protein
VIACALVANAASFVLPIANPSNLLVFAHRMPGLGTWLAAFALPSLAALGVTFAILALLFRRDLAGGWTRVDDTPAPRPDGAIVAVLLLAAGVIVATSAREGPLGTAAAACALGAFLVAALRTREGALQALRRVSWPVVALTAALFVIVGAVDAGGGLTATTRALGACARLTAPWSSVATGFLIAGASNIVNNLPVGLVLGEALPAMHAAPALTHAALVGVNLGPNASVNGSLATLLWLAIVRRAGIAVSPARFAAVGVATTAPALFAALVALR